MRQCLPHLPRQALLDWNLDDPAGRAIDAVRPIRDQIEQHIRALIDELT
jgi:arsenate reductase (thioredoxin)